jgi:hypothetical protein
MLCLMSGMGLLDTPPGTTDRHLRIPAGRSRIAVMAGQGKIGARLEPMPDAMLPAGCGARTVNRFIGPITIFALSAGRADDIFTPSRKECERLHRQK